MQQQPAYLVLENGAVFPGQAMGAPGDNLGEVVFTTAMTGYLETLTDPSYTGQIVVQSFPLIGNYGVIPADFESQKPHLSGYIVQHWCHAPSNFRQEGALDAFLTAHNIPGLCGIDTRALVKLLREAGTLRGKIVHSLEEREQQVEEAQAFQLRDVVERATCRERAVYAPAGEARFHVVLWDFGAKQGIVEALLREGCRVTRVPAGSTAKEILALTPDGVMLSNGPGDPAVNLGIIREIGELCGAKISLFGICLGHQLLALARGAKTEKLHYGHRGANQPVKDLETGGVYITSQNHGYAVRGDSLPAGAVVRYQNANDGTCEGVDYGDIPAFSVQFHPEGCAGPGDTGFLFHRFAQLMEVNQ